MKKSIAVIALFILTAVFPFLQFNPLAQEDPTEISNETSQVESKDKSAAHALKTIKKAQKEISAEIKLLISKAKKARTSEEKLVAEAILNDEIPKLKKQLAKLKKDFESIVIGGDLSSFPEKVPEKFNWRDEVLDLVTPLIREVKNMTARPRQVEKCRTDMAFYTEQIREVNEALENIDLLLDQTGESEDIKAALLSLKKNWEARKKQAENELTVAEYKLKELEDERQSLLDSIQKFLRSFFRERGRNVVVAFVAFCLVFVVLRLIHRLIYRYSPIHDPENRTFFVRLSDILYHIFTFLGSLGALLFVLYLSGDWLLLSIAIIFVVGLAWTAKEGLPRFWQEIQLILNLGPVRENELIIYNGISWRVVTLNFYAVLENLALKTKEIRLPLKALIGMNSRPFHKDDPWFPCHIGDWVILSDGTRGEVITQTPEFVQLKQRGGSLKTYLTQDFLGSNPLNLSADFRLKVVFGFDYEHQAMITEKMPAKLVQELRQGLSDMGYDDDIIQLNVEVETAGASSLDLVIIADFHGRIAALYNKLKRTFQKLTIEACTAHGWGIPFPQVTVHTKK